MNHQVCDQDCEKDCCKDKYNSYDGEEDDEEYYDEDYGTEDKWRYSLYSAVIFVIISSPYAYMLTNGILGSLVSISSRVGCPKLVGLLLHAIVFMLIIRGMMELDI